MSEYFLGEIRMFPFAFAPKGWALADGSILQVQQNQALFSLLSDTYGGDGRTTFALPDLRGRVPIHFGHTATSAAYPLGSRGGLETVPLTPAQAPPHSHELGAQTTTGTVGNASNALIAQVALDAPTGGIQRYLYGPPMGTLTAMAPDSIGSEGGGGRHPNLQPFAVVNCCIAMTGNYPPHQ